jgi:hypothetical protein
VHHGAQHGLRGGAGRPPGNVDTPAVTVAAPRVRDAGMNESTSGHSWLRCPSGGASRGRGGRKHATDGHVKPTSSLTSRSRRLETASHISRLARTVAVYSRRNVRRVFAQRSASATRSEPEHDVPKGRQERPVVDPLATRGGWGARSDSPGVIAEETSAATVRQKTCSAPPVIRPSRPLGSLEPDQRHSPTDRAALPLQFQRGATQIAQPTAAASPSSASPATCLGERFLTPRS